MMKKLTVSRKDVNYISVSNLFVSEYELEKNNVNIHVQHVDFPKFVNCFPPCF